MHQASAGTVLREWGADRLHRLRRPADAHRAAARPVRERRGWLGDREFEDAIAACNLLPGPASTQLAIYCAWRVARARSARVVGGLGVHRARAGRRSSRSRRSSSPTRRPTGCAAPAAGAGAAVAAVARAGRVGPRARRAAARGAGGGRVRWVVYARARRGWRPRRSGRGSCSCCSPAARSRSRAARRRGAARRAPASHAWPLLVAAAPAAGGLGALAWVALKVGALSYGGGFVIIPLMQGDAVDRYHWMTDSAVPQRGRARAGHARARSSTPWRPSATPPPGSAAGCWPRSSRSRRRSRSSSLGARPLRPPARQRRGARVPRRRRPGRDRRDPRLGASRSPPALRRGVAVRRCSRAPRALLLVARRGRRAHAARSRGRRALVVALAGGPLPR